MQMSPTRISSLLLFSEVTLRQGKQPPSNASTPTEIHPTSSVARPTTNPYIACGVGTVAGAGAGFGIGALWPTPTIRNISPTVRELELDGHVYTEHQDSQKNVLKMERRLAKNMQSQRQPAEQNNPNYTLNLIPVQKSESHPKLITHETLEVSFPVNRTFKEMVDTIVQEPGKKDKRQNKPKEGHFEGTLKLAYEKRVIEEQVPDAAGLPGETKLQQRLENPGFRSLEHRLDNGQEHLSASMNYATKTIEYKRNGKTYILPNEVGKFGDLSLGKESELLVDLRQDKDIQADPKPMILPDFFLQWKRDTEKKPAITDAAIQVKTHVNDAYTEYNIFHTLDAVLAHKKEGIRTAGLWVGAVAGLAAGLGAWGYWKWKATHPSGPAASAPSSISPNTKRLR
jgi:hypothetical protein